MTKETPGVGVRRLGNGERACWLVDQVCSFKIVFAARIEGILEPAAVRAALDRVQESHPMLRARIRVDGRQPEFVTDAPPIPLQVDGNAETESVVFAAIEQELSRELDWERGPLAHARLLSGPQGALILTLHHAISDGISGAQVMAELLAGAAAVQLGTPHFLPRRPLRPSIEALLGAAHPQSEKAGARLRYFFQQAMTALQKRPQILPAQTDVPLQLRQSRFVLRSLSAAQLHALASRCREEQTTVHGSLCAALLCAVTATVWPSRSSQHPVCLTCCTPTNLREHLHPPLPREVGLMVAPAVTLHHVSPASAPWSLAREIGASVRRCRDLGDLYTGLLSQSSLLPARISPRLAARMLYNPLFGTVAVTNLGRLDLPLDPGPFRLRALHFVPSNQPFASFISLSVASIETGMSLVFNYNARIHPQQRVEQIADRTLRTLHELLRSGLPR